MKQSCSHSKHPQANTIQKLFGNINCPSYVASHLASDETGHVIVCCTVQNHKKKLNRLVCTCFSIMSFVFAPAAKNKPNLQNVFTSMTLSMKLPSSSPTITWGYICLLTFVFLLLLFFCWVLVYVVKQRLHGILPR